MVRNPMPITIHTMNNFTITTPTKLKPNPFNIYYNCTTTTITTNTKNHKCIF